MNFEYITITILIVFTILLSIEVVRLRDVIKRHIGYQTSELQVHRLYLKYIMEASTSNLWKIRQELRQWQEEYVKHEEYEVANVVKEMVEHIEKLIQTHNKINKQENESNDIKK